MFDELFELNPRPIIVMCDEANELYATKVLRVRRSPLFLIDTLSGTISDVELKRTFTTLVCLSGETYNLKSIEQSYGLGSKGAQPVAASDRQHTVELVDEVLTELRELGV